MSIIVFAVLLVVIGYGIYNNHHIVTTQYIYSGNFSEDFDGYRVLQISDIHADLPDWKSRELYRKTMKAHPDIVVVTGDCVDHIHFKNHLKVMTFFEKVAQKYPLYIISGNHEYMHPECYEFLKEMNKRGLNVLHNEYVDLCKGNRYIRMYGVDDPYALYKGKIPNKYKTPVKAYRDIVINSINIERQGMELVILLAHRPELFELYCEKGFDIVFAGHAHGGQWRLPLLGGIIAPDQGLFPKYTGGCYCNKRTTMYVSRGVGNSVVPIRIFNNPELVIVEMRSERKAT